MPVDWKKYAADWKDIAKAKKAAVGWKCEECGRQCRKPEEKFDTHRRTLTVHHELLHVGIDREETLIGANEKYYIRHHDLDDFQLIIRQYGVDWSHSN